MGRRPEDLPVDGQGEELHPVLKRQIGRRGLFKAAGGGAAGAVLGFFVRDSSAGVDRATLEKENQTLRDQLAKRDRDDANAKERKIGPEPGISYEVVDWNVLVPVDEVERYREAHPTHNLDFIFEGPGSYSHLRIGNKRQNPDQPFDYKPDIRSVGDKKVYVLDSLPGGEIIGEPGNFYAQISENNVKIASKQESIPLDAFNETAPKDKRFGPRVYSLEEPKKEIGQTTVDELAKFSSDLDPYSFITGPRIYIQRNLSPDETSFKSTSTALQVDLKPLRNTPSGDQYFYQILREVAYIALSSYQRQVIYPPEPIFPAVKAIQDTPISDVFRYALYVPAAAENEKYPMLPHDDKFEHLSDIVTILRYFPDIFISNFKSLTDEQKDIARKNVSDAAQALKEISTRYTRKEAQIINLIPSYPDIEKTLAA